MTTLRRMTAVLAVLATVGCGDDPLGPDPEDVEFAASLGVDLAAMTRLASGVYVQTTTPGSGTATVAAGSTVDIEYNGWLADGTLFDDGTITDYPANQFVPGFTEGLIGMKVGEVRRIVIPARLGYGSAPNGPIPGNSVLVFEVRLIGIS